MFQLRLVFIYLQVGRQLSEKNTKKGFLGSRGEKKYLIL